MKRLILGVAIASALGLSGCGGEDSVNELRDNIEPLIPESHLVFDPTAGKVPLPSDLLFSGTLDGTLAIPGEEGGDYTNPQYAIGALDGWSTTQPISIDFAPSRDHGGNLLSLNAASVFQSGAVRVFEATVGGALSSDAECKAAPSVSACKIGDELQFGVDFISQAVGNKIVIVPLKPLKAGQSYIYATTTLIEDSENRPVATSSTYGSVKMDITTHPLGTEAQRGLQALVNSYENALESKGVDKASITYSSLFTTQSVNPAYETLKLLMVSNDAFKPSFDMFPTPTGMTVAQMAGMSPEMGLPYVLSDLADVYVAKIKLPVYSDCSANGCLTADMAPKINGRWTALGDSPVSVLLALQAGTLSQQNFGAQAMAQGIEDPAAALANPALLAGKQFKLDDGTPADKTRHVTKFNPIPAPKTYESVSVLMTLPNAAKLKAFTEAQGQAFVPPANGWPVNIAMHGLGGGKEMALAYAGTYAAAGVATVAIDMPLHGERSFDANKDGIYEISATDPSFGPVVGKPDAFKNGSPLVFVNIASSLSVRDNFRQAVADHLGVRLALTGMAQYLAANNQPQVFDVSKVSSQGLSLGGIVNTNFATYASTGLVDPTTGTQLPNPYAITAASLVAPSGGLAGAFAGSATFGPVLFSTITGTPEFQAMVDAANTAGYEPGSPEYAALVQQVYAGFIPTFAFAIQTGVDSIDPVNHAGMLKATGLPVHLIEVVGDGNGNLPDQVLPNSVEGFPLSGTEPLIANLGLECRDTTAQGGGAVRFIKGHHSSIVDPSENGATDGKAAAATAEMQWQVAGFAKSASAGTATILVNDASVLKACD
ncbi:VolA/Pla-1 family phospholipase [Shewanella sp. FJAT-52076]|uniref:VolA/Pla-1 family phospholipase n=1 Tax=Shewanella sp. FJAT-52076 TaxID=2864202 RepID=UPI001C65617B|nr:VolA/Pla-1 family phospholipase [Shewanella sp. FJAT-52076]QYJ73919.1 lipase [Shewanella sp. FJAT-52076]